MKLIPGIDTNRTPALNEAAFSESQLVRFIKDRNGYGLVQKMGGWLDWTTLLNPAQYTPIVIPGINELHPWQDINLNDRLAVGADTQLAYINASGRQYNNITPQQRTSNIGLNSSVSCTFTVATNRVTPSSGFVPPDSTPVVFSAVGGVTGITVGTTYYVVNGTSTYFQISLTIGGAPVIFGGTATGSPAFYIPTVSVTSGSSIVTMVDTAIGNIGVSFTNSGGSQTATFNTTNNTVSVTTIPGDNTVVTFSSTGTLPTGISNGSLYYVVNAGATTFQVSSTIGGTAIDLTGTPSGVATMTIPTIVSYTTTGNDAPISTATVVFQGASLPTGITAGTQYYVQEINSTTFYLTDAVELPYSFIGTTSTGTGTMFLPDQIRVGYSIDIKTPVSIANLLLSGIYVIKTYTANNLYSVFTFDCGTNATSTTSSSTLPTFGVNTGFSDVLVTEINHPYIDGDVATFLVSTSSSGMIIYANYIVSDVTSTTYKIIANSSASATTTFTMNSGNLNVVYYYNIPSLTSAGGYGTGFYGYGGYGQGQKLTYPQAPGITTTDWVINNYGEILIANPEGGPVYYWSPTSATALAQLLNTAPLTNAGNFVSMPSRQLVLYGSTLNGIQDPLLMRWSDVADFTVWQATANNQAGSYRIPEGSTIVGAMQGPQQGFVWTDLALWSMQYVGAPYVFSFNKISEGCGLIAKKAWGTLGNTVYWMSPKKFNRMAGGGPEDIDCPIWDTVFQNINLDYASEIRCATNSIFNEVTWYYPSANSNTNDLYVKYDIETGQWDYGSLDRVAWADQSVLGMPLGADANGYIYQHETGYNNNLLPMTSYFKTGYMALNEADNLVFIDQIWPNMKWQTTDLATDPAVLYITFYGANYPGDTPTVYGPYEMTQSTEYIATRIRNRLLAIQISTADGYNVSASNIFYRVGAMRYRYQLDGKY